MFKVDEVNAVRVSIQSERTETERKNVKDVEKNVKKEYNENEEINEKNIDKIVKQLNENVDNLHKGIKFEKEEKLNSWVVKVFNEQTGEVIRQIPSKELIEIAKGIEDVMGMIFDKKV